MRPVGSLAPGSKTTALVSRRDPAGAPFQTSSSSRPSTLSRGDVTGLLDTGAGGSPTGPWTSSGSASWVSRNHVSSAETVPGSDEIFIAPENRRRHRRGDIGE